MRSYIKYIVLFVTLVLVGFVSLNFYSNSKLDDKFKTTESKTSTGEDTKKKKEETSNNKKEDTTASSTEESKENTASVSDVQKTEVATTDTDSSNSDSSSLSENIEDTTGSGEEVAGSETTTQNSVIQRSSSVTYRYDNITTSTDALENSSVESNSSTSVLSGESSISVVDVDTTVEEDDDDEEIEFFVETDTGSNTDVVSQSSTTTSQSPANQNSKSSSSSSSNNGASSSAKKASSASTTIKDGTVIGATGYSALNSKKYLRTKASNNSAAIVVLKGGVPFKILATKKNDTWWKVQYKGKIGYVENAYCMINLPDYIPSITYRITNATKSIYKSSGVKLSITGKQLYKTGKVYNERLGKNQFIVPVMYSFAQKILVAQKAALREGYSLKIYDAYRPTSVSTEIKNSLQSLYVSNTTVRNKINYASNGSYWGQGWFLAQNLSAHNVASAIDVTLTKKGSTKSLKMPTRMHELSTAAIKYSSGVSGQTTVRNDLYASSMNTSAKKLDSFMMKAGLTNLASEWWHFQDNEAYSRIKAYEPSGLNFQPSKVVSSK